MSLYHLLTDRTAVRLLKLLYDNELQNKGTYTMKLSEAGNKLNVSNASGSAEMLSSLGLIGIDSLNGDHIMSMTNKGKEFIEIFDQLVELFMTKEQKQSNKVKVRYELTAQEKRILVLTYRVSKEIGRDFIAMKTLVEELFPNQKNKTSTVSRYVSRLEELRLMERKKEGRNSFVKVTEKGFRTIREQYLNGLMH